MSVKGKMLNIVGRAVLAAALTALFFLLLQRLLMPKYMSGVYEGRLIGEYYKEKKTHDVIIIGDCEVYENISPVALWESCGIASYVRGSPMQLMWQSYHLLEDTLRYEKPKVVVFSVLGMKYDKPQSEAYNRLTLDGMRMSLPKLRSVRASMTADEDWITYIFPLLRYHDRWRELGADDFKYFLRGGSVSHNGFTMRCDIKPVTVVPSGPKLPSYRFGSVCYDYLDKITSLCEQNGIGLILFKAPSLYPHWYAEWDEQIAEYATEHGLRYINTLGLTDEIGLDFQTDTYNAGLNLNLSGAEKLSAYLGNVLINEYGLADNRTDARMRAIWDEKIEKYYAMRDAQLRDIEQQGKVMTFTYD